MHIFKHVIYYKCPYDSPFVMFKTSMNTGVYQQMEIYTNSF